MSEFHQLPREARQVLLRLELVSAGPVARLDAEGGRSSERPSRPAGPSDRDDAIPHLVYGRRMVAAVLEGRPLGPVVREAEEALEGLLRTPPAPELVPETDKERDARIVKEGEGWGINDVAVALNVTHSQVIAARSRKDLPHELDVATGLKVRPEETKQERVCRLGRDTEMSVREIADAAQVPSATVHRWLRTEKAA